MYPYVPLPAIPFSMITSTYPADSQYEADPEMLRTSFERYGQIKTYFDLLKQRGMVFITYVSRFDPVSDKGQADSAA